MTSIGKSVRTELDEEILSVLALEVPKIDREKKFPRLEKQKLIKKDRHIVEVDEFAQFLSDFSENSEKEVLLLSRNVRENLENIDICLQGYYANLRNDEYIIVRSEAQLIEIREEILAILSNRLGSVEEFASNLDKIETKRAKEVGDQLKRLTDKLISIAHKLPNEIEHLVETETFELNTVVTKNRHSYAQLIALMKKKCVEVEVESFQVWEDSRRHWRQLRHDKGLKDFTEDILSSKYWNPENRKEFLKEVRVGQEERMAERMKLIDELGSLNAHNIISSSIVNIQKRFGVINETEIAAIQLCYNKLTELRLKLNEMAKLRVEELRLELHEYGALKDEPKLKDIALILEEATESAELSELFRLGGGMKGDFNAMVQEMRSVNIVYDAHTRGIEVKSSAIMSGFDIKEILESRGRLIQLDKIRSLIVKLRNVSRDDVPDVLNSLMPELEEHLEIDKFSEVFRKELSTCYSEMQVEMREYREINASISQDATMQHSLQRQSMFKTSSANSMKSGLPSVNPLSVKRWAKKLGILYYSSDLPPVYQEACKNAFAGALQQLECNKLVDEVIMKTCDAHLKRIDKTYTAIIEQIATHLEAQASALLTNALNIGSFYLLVAKCMERHRKRQVEVDERSLDELFDQKEEFRLESEDLQHDFDEACANLKAATDLDELNENFEAVLVILSEIQESYRGYHKRACLIADKHPVMLMFEFCEHLKTICKRFEVAPLKPNLILDKYRKVYDKLMRINKPLLEEEDKWKESLPVEVFTIPGMFVNNVDDEIDKILAEEKRIAEEEKAALAAQAAAMPVLTKQTSTISKPVKLGASGKKNSVLEATQAAFQAEAAAKAELEQAAALAKRRADLEVEILAKKRAEAYKGEYVSSIEQGYRNMMKNEERERLLDTKSKSIAPGMDEMSTVGSLPTASMTASMSIVNDVPRGGVYGLLVTPESIIQDFTLEKTMQVLEEQNTMEDIIESPDKSAAVTGKNSEDQFQGDLTDVAAELGIAPPPVYENMPWLQTIVTLLSEEELEEVRAVYADDVFAYERTVARAFVPLDDAVVATLTPEQQEKYSACAELVRRVNARVLEESDPAFIRAHIPVDDKGNRLVLLLEISQSHMLELFCNLRDSIFTTLELEMQRRIVTVEELCKSRKDSLTEELEDRIRTHWPRRGRVETQIKQPREAELLSHEEKTWRLIQNLQGQMMEIQNLFFAEVIVAKQACDLYISEINSLKNIISNTQFKTLAALQGYDVKARSTTIAFQQSCLAHYNKLASICNEQCAEAISYAQNFRKICPPQEAGKEGGYSEAEIAEIQRLMDDQCTEINGKSEEWLAEVQAVKEQQTQSLLCYEEFRKRFEKCTQDLAMSEGLGQKYGAPRRRAQERIRTEVSRDEQSAGCVDELLAKLEFVCTEKQRVLLESGQLTESKPEEDDDMSVSPTSSPRKASLTQVKVNTISNKDLSTGGKQFEFVREIWKHLIQLRAVLAQRMDYLEVHGDKKLPVIPLSFISGERESFFGITAPAAEEGSLSDGGVVQLSPRYLRTGAMKLAELVQDVDKQCRKETRDLYISEGKAEMLQGDTPDSVPEALSTWLSEMKEKILGRDGHKEKAWKRLWGQIDRLEYVLCRKPPSITNLAAPQSLTSSISSLRIILGAPAACLRYLMEAYLNSCALERQRRVDSFMKSVRVWVKGRDKHERLLRPRLGSPDAVEELNQLDAMELQRSREMLSCIYQFRVGLLRRVMEISLQYFTDIGVASKNMMLYIDTSLTQELVQLPPDTVIPKVRMTLKRLRKAERIKSEIAKGSEDRSASRVWPGIELDSLDQLKRVVERIVTGDLSSYEKIIGSALDESPVTLVPPTWRDEIVKGTSVRALVSTAHRSVIKERNRDVSEYVLFASNMAGDIVQQFDSLITQECSWNERWKRQVDMLRNGNV